LNRGLRADSLIH